MRSITAQIELPLDDPHAVFQTLITPSEINQWWQSKTAIVLPQAGGRWAANWGDDPDLPDYSMFATISDFDPPHRLTMTDFQYFSKDGPMPFEADFRTEFTVEKTDRGVKLVVLQSGFPDDPSADDYYAGCVTGWKNTLAGIEQFLTKKHGL